MPTPYEAPCLRGLRIALDRRWPERDRRSDGWIGDARHQASKSDHNPDPVTGEVRARDIDKDGIHTPTVHASLMLHPATAYVIFRRRIYSRSRGFLPVEYTGVNAHLEHLHVSVTKGLTTRTDLWYLIERPPNWGDGIKVGDDGQRVRELQAYLTAYGLPCRPDGQFGPATDRLLRQFQAAHGLTVDGVAGPRTLATFRGVAR